MQSFKLHITGYYFFVITFFIVFASETSEKQNNMVFREHINELKATGVGFYQKPSPWLLTYMSNI